MDSMVLTAFRPSFNLKFYDLKSTSLGEKLNELWVGGVEDKNQLFSIQKVLPRELSRLKEAFFET